MLYISLLCLLCPIINIKIYYIKTAFLFYFCQALRRKSLWNITPYPSQSSWKPRTLLTHFVYSRRWIPTSYPYNLKLSAIITIERSQLRQTASFVAPRALQKFKKHSPYKLMSIVTRKWQKIMRANRNEIINGNVTHFSKDGFTNVINAQCDILVFIWK